MSDMELYNETQKVIKAIKNRFNIYHEVPCTADDRRVQEIISIVIQTIEALPSADVAPKSEVERLTVELDAMRGAANSYKMHYENAKAEVARLETENLILKQKRLNLFDRLEFVKMARAKGAIEVIEHLENEGLLNMTPQGIANLKKKYDVTDTNVGGKYTEVENGT